MITLPAQAVHRAGVSATPDELAEWVRIAAADADIVIVDPPRPVLTMLRVCEPVADAEFAWGELLLTQCAVTVAEAPGWACLLGDERRRCLLIAVLDACARSGLPAHVAEAIQAGSDRHAELQNARWHAVAATRVEFEEMPFQ
jgi:phosphonate C-P lyase system protein PhnG